MACHRMPAAVLLCSTLASAALAADPPSVQTPAAPARALNLGPYGRPYSNPLGAGTTSPLPRFESSVDVEGKAPPPDLNQTMAVWWDHFDISTGSVYGKGIATRNTIDLVPLVEWLARKVKEKREKK